MTSLALPWPDDAESIWRTYVRREREQDWQSSCRRIARAAAAESGSDVGRAESIAQSLERRELLLASTHWRDQASLATPVVYLNLIAAVLDPYGPGARPDYDTLRRQVSIGLSFGRPGVRFGLLGLADALVLMGQRYDSWTGRGVAQDLLGTIQSAIGDAPARLTLESDGLVCALAGHAAPSLDPLRRDRPSYARSLWLSRFPDAPWPHALQHAADPPSAARAAMLAALRPWFSAGIAGSG